MQGTNLNEKMCFYCVLCALVQALKNKIKRHELNKIACFAVLFLNSLVLPLLGSALLKPCRSWGREYVLNSFQPW